MLIPSLLTTMMLAIPGVAETPPEVNLDPGQELVYSGTYRISSAKPGRRYEWKFSLVNRLFVIASSGPASEVAVLTVATPEQGRNGTNAPSCSLGLARFSQSQGLKFYPPASEWDPSGADPNEEIPPLPLNGPPRLVNGALFAISPGSWAAGDIELVKGSRARRLESRQQSEDWDEPAEGRIAWRLTDVVWVSPLNGYALRFTRTIELRDTVDRGTPTELELDMGFERRMHYPSRLAESIREEAVRTWEYVAECDRLLPQAGRPESANDFGQLAEKVRLHATRNLETPYRQALRALEVKIDAARKGDVAPR